MLSVVKVISGGQTGVDQAALFAAHAAGLEIGGWCPPGRLCDAGLIPCFFPLQETPSDRSSLTPHVPRSQRTEWNVRDSDATLVLQLTYDDDPGTQNTLDLCYRYRRHVYNLSLLQDDTSNLIHRWLSVHKVKTLNVAGPSEKTQPGVGDATFALLSGIFSDLVT